MGSKFFSEYCGYFALHMHTTNSNAYSLVTITIISLSDSNFCLSLKMNPLSKNASER